MVTAPAGLDTSCPMPLSCREHGTEAAKHGRGPELGEWWPGVSTREVPAAGRECRQRLAVALFVCWKPRLLRGSDKRHKFSSMAVVAPALRGPP